jgi:hypothetical protein
MMDLERLDNGAPESGDSWLPWPMIDSFFPFRLPEALML